MSDEINSKIVVTLKGGGGYEAPWIVIHAESVDEMATIMSEVTETGLTVAVKGLADQFRTVMTGNPQAVASAALGAVEISAPAMSGQPVVPGPGAPAGNGVGNYPAPSQPQFAPGQPQQLPPGLNPPCPTCGGPTQFKSGIGSRGEWKGYFCVNAPKNANPKHDVTWIR